TYLVNRSPSSAIGFRKPIDMLGFFGWLASIEQGMLEPVTVKCNIHGIPQKYSGEQHLACELFGYREDINEAAFAVAVVEKIYAHESSTFNSTAASTIAGNAVTIAMAINGSIHQATKGLLAKAKGNILSMEIVRDHSGNTLRVSQSRFYNEKLSCIYAVGSQEYQMVCTRPDIASTDVGMLDGFDRGLQTYVQVFVDFDYAMGRSITVMGRSITRYGFMILGCAGSLKANLQDMKALSTTEAGYMTFTEA
nr:zinc finger, CCHC-type [Tanacetum cinerariifolium]